MRVSRGEGSEPREEGRRWKLGRHILGDDYPEGQRLGRGWWRRAFEVVGDVRQDKSRNLKWKSYVLARL